MGHDEDDDRVDALDQDPADDEDLTETEDEGRIPPPTIEETLGFEGSIEGL